MPIRVVLGEDNYLVREGLHRLLETRSEITVAAACGDLPSLLDAIKDARPDVVVTDIRMPPGCWARSAASTTAPAGGGRSGSPAASA